MAAKTATAAFDATARTSDRRYGAGCCPSPQLGWGARDERRPTGTEDSQRGSSEYFDLFSGDGRPAGEERLAALLEPRPQPGVQRHTLEHVVEICPYVQILDVPVPQREDQVPLG